MRIRAALLEQFGAPLVVQELELAEPRAGEVLVRLQACGVCHTDMYTASGVDPSGYAPTVLGHEGAGVVEARRRRTSATSPSAITSSRCSRRSAASASTVSARARTSAWRFASSRTRATCPTAATRLSRDGEPIRHFMGTSTFAEYAVIPEIALAKVDREAPLDRACLFACGLSTGLGAAIYTAKVEPGSTCVVFGAGMVGLGAVAGCRLQGAERIICVDLSEQRLELARGQGATDTWIADGQSSSACSRRPAASAPTTRSRRPAWSRSCAKPSRRRGWAGGCARSPASPARARRSTSCRAC